MVHKFWKLELEYINGAKGEYIYNTFSSMLESYRRSSDIISAYLQIRIYDTNTKTLETETINLLELGRQLNGV